MELSKIWIQEQIYHHIAHIILGGVLLYLTGYAWAFFLSIGIEIGGLMEKKKLPGPIEKIEWIDSILDVVSWNLVPMIVYFVTVILPKFV